MPKLRIQGESRGKGPGRGAESETIPCSCLLRTLRTQTLLLIPEGGNHLPNPLPSPIIAFREPSLASILQARG